MSERRVSTKIQVRCDDFCVAEEEALLRSCGGPLGAIVTFTGCVRSGAEDSAVYRLTLEHYPGMTESTIGDIVAQAGARWELLAVTVIHRVGDLEPGDHIVYVGVSSSHRGDAFAACEYIMDFLKTRAPFWKKESTAGGDHWVEARDSDRAAVRRWQQTGHEPAERHRIK